MTREHSGGNKRGRASKVCQLASSFLVVVAAILVSFLVDESVAQPFEFVTFLFAVVFCTWFGGLRCGLFALGLSIALINFVFSDPRFRFVFPDAQMGLEIFVYGILGIGSIWLVELQQRGKQDAETAAAAAKNEANQRRLAEDALRIAQYELKQYAGTLEEKVNERTQELEQSLRFLRSFLYSMAHEIRAPVRALQGFTLALTEDYGRNLDETAQDYCNRISGAASRLDILISELLDYGRIAHMEMPLEIVNLENLFALAESDLNIESYVTRPKNLPEVLAHPVATRIALTNLLSNAAKFIPADRTPLINVSIEEREDRVQVFISDNGIGIQADHFERIFEPFQRLHGQDAFSGSGIGLALVRLAMERIGGSVGVRSESGKGSCFWLDFQKVDTGRI